MIPLSYGFTYSRSPWGRLVSGVPHECPPGANTELSRAVMAHSAQEEKAMGYDYRYLPDEDGSGRIGSDR